MLPLSEERFARLVAKEADRGGGLGGAASWSLAAGLGFRDCISSDFPLVVGDRAAPQPREHRGHAHGGPIRTLMNNAFEIVLEASLASITWTLHEDALTPRQASKVKNREQGGKDSI